MKESQSFFKVGNLYYDQAEVEEAISRYPSSLFLITKIERIEELRSNYSFRFHWVLPACTGDDGLLKGTFYLVKNTKDSYLLEYSGLRDVIDMNGAK